MFDSIQEKIKETYSSYLNIIRIRIFGKNNEKIDFIIDSFYKLPPEKRTLSLAVAVVFALGLFVGVLSLYFERSNQLDNDLDISFKSYSQLQSKKVEYNVERKKLDNFIFLLESKNDSLRIKPYFEKMSKLNNIEIKDIKEKDVESDLSDPFFEKVTEVLVEMKLPKISIPKLMGFLVDVEKSNYFFRIKDLKIKGLYGNKLYFDSRVSFRTYRITG